MKNDGYHDDVPVCNTEYWPEVRWEDGRYLWCVNGTDYGYDGEELGTGGVVDGDCATLEEATAMAEAACVRARSEVTK